MGLGGAGGSSRGFGGGGRISFNRREYDDDDDGSNDDDDELRNLDDVVMIGVSVRTRLELLAGDVYRIGSDIGNIDLV